MSRDGGYNRGGGTPYRSPGIFVVILVIIAFAAMALALVPNANAVWSTTNPGINYWVTPNYTDNGTPTVYYAGEVWPVDAIQYGWTTTRYFYLNVKSDNYPNNANLKWVINGVVLGPVPSSNWVTNGWVGFALWNGSSWSYSGATDGIVLPDVDNGESFLARIAFNFQNEAVKSAGYWFPGEVQVQLKLYNTDNAETYWTPTLSWWVWDYNLENTVNYAVADTYTSSTAVSTNYGTGTTMTVYYTSVGVINTSWLKFPLTIPANWGVQHAYLRYYVNSTSGTATYKYIYTTENVTWVENEITYNNSGGLSPTPNGQSSTQFGTSVGWQTMDIIDVIRPRISAGDVRVSLFLFVFPQSQTLTMTIRSKEYGDGSYAPQLILETAPMGPSVPPTFDVDMNGTTTSSRSGDSYNLLLRGRVDNMGDDYSANFMFRVSNADSSWYRTYTYPTAVSAVGFFSLTTTGYEYAEDTDYYISLQCHGNGTQTYTWMPASGGYVFYIHDNHVYWTEPVTPPTTYATITTMPADSILQDKARLRYTLDIGGEGWVDVTFRMGDNVDNTDNYSVVDVGRLTAGVTNGAKLVEGLAADTTYWFNTYGDTESGDRIYGNPLTFKTLISAPPPVAPPTLPPISTWGEAVGEKFGIGKEAGGIFLTLLFAMPLLFVVMFLTQGSNNSMLIVLASALMLMSVAVAFTWCPIWIPLVVVLILIFGISRGWMAG